MRKFSLTYPQLMNQALASGFDEGFLKKLRFSYELAQKYFDGFYRAQGDPFLCHLVRTASIVLAEKQPVEIAMAALLHSAYLFGNGPAQIRKNELREILGEEIESLIAGYSKLPWRQVGALQKHLDQLESYSQKTRQLLLLRLINELEDHLDFAMLYRGGFPYKEWIAAQGKLIVELAKQTASLDLAAELHSTLEETLKHQIPASLTRGYRDAYELPEHARLRKGLWKSIWSRLRRLTYSRNEKN